jgi:hypothetical protein
MTTAFTGEHAGKPGRKPGRKPKSGTGTTSAAGVSKATADNLVEDVATVRRLVGRVGAETVRGLVELFA